MAFGPLVEASWLLDRLGDPGLVVIDTRWRLGSPGAGEGEFGRGHIPGAAFLDVDLDLAAAPGAGGRHPLPAAADFEAAVRTAGVDGDSRVVAYDDAELGGAARLWWLLRHFGHRQAAVLDGGLAAWKAAGGKLEAGPSRARPPGGFRAARPASDTAGAAELLAGGVRLLDARAPERYRGETEPVDAVAGHIPGAANVPYASLAPGGRYLPARELRERLGDEPFVAYCGSGVSACTLVLAAEVAGVRGARLYPGSWSEWSGRGLPAE